MSKLTEWSSVQLLHSSNFTFASHLLKKASFLKISTLAKWCDKYLCKTPARSGSNFQIYVSTSRHFCQIKISIVQNIPAQLIMVLQHRKLYQWVWINVLVTFIELKFILEKMYGFSYPKINSAGFINIWQFKPSFKQFIPILRP